MEHPTALDHQNTIQEIRWLAYIVRKQIIQTLDQYKTK